MLVISRKEGQEICIDGEIVIRVLESRGNTIRIGVDAPKEIRVLRAEVKDRDTASKRADGS